VRDLLTRNGVPFTLVTPEDPDAAGMVARAGHQVAAECLVEFHDGTVLSAPDDVALGRAFGFLVEPPERVFDVSIIGAGPAGLATAVYAAADGLDDIVIEAESMGGQSSSSSLIRNYLGFARGIGGAELALQAYQQAWVFGATMLMMRRVTALRHDGPHVVLNTTGGYQVRCRSVVLAMGVTYRRLGVPELDELVGAGVFYGGASGAGARVRGGHAYVVGGGNSAGQAALHLARDAQRVHLVIRGQSLDTMSSYLVAQLHDHPAIEIHLGSEVVGGGGDGYLTYLELRDRSTGERARVPAKGLFVLIGATPHTDWLAPEFDLDEQGFIRTGSDVVGGPARPFETSVAAVFAAGDVRHGSLKRVGAAVGEGAAVAREAFDVVHGTDAS
jgi:thioredoxin reductase (NADPH)